MIDRTTPAILAAAVLLTGAGAVAVTRLPGHGMRAVPAARPPATLALPYGPADRLAEPVAAPAAMLRAGDGGAAIYAAGAESTDDAARLLTSAGVPALVAASPADALTHPVVVWVGELPPADVARVTAYVNHGGILVVFGASAAAEQLAAATGRRSATRSTVQVLPGGGVSAAQLHLAPFPGTGWQRAGGVLARYDDGSAAWVLRRTGLGAVALAGVPLSALVAATPAAGDPGARDVAASVTRALYQLSPLGITLGSAPAGDAQALVLTHDLDSPPAYSEAAGMAQIEADRGVTSTFFAVTRTAASGADPLLTPAAAGVLRDLAQRGFDIGAGGVVPDRFGSLAAGTGSESYPGYAPAAGAGGATRSGEVRVSAHVVGAVTGTPPTAFRPPALLDGGAATGLDATLAGAGLGAEAAVAASASGGSLPFRAALTTGEEYAVLRLPVAFDDRAGPRVDTRNDELTAVLAHAAATGAPAVVRISPSAGSAATFAEQRLLAELPAATWVGSARDYASFWSARYALTLGVAAAGDALLVRLSSPGHTPGQTLVTPFPVASATLRASGERLAVSADRRHVAVPPFTGAAEIELAAAA